MIAERCRHEFSQTTELRGEEYFRAGRVIYLEVEGKAATAEVTGSSGRKYSVDLCWADAQDGVVQASCTCAHFDDGFLCKHIWAVLRQLDSIRHAPAVPGQGQLQVEAYCVDDDDEADRSLDDFFADVIEQVAPRSLQPADRPQSKSQWRSRLEQVKRLSDSAIAVDAVPSSDAKPKQIWYVVNIADCVKYNAVVVDFMFRPLKKDGNWGKFRPLGVRRHHLDDVADGLDRELLELLTTSDGRLSGVYQSANYNRYGYGYGYGYAPSVQDCWLTPKMAELVLPSLCRSERLIWALNETVDFDQCRHPAWDGGPVWRIGLDVETNEKAQEWRIRGKLTRGDQSRSLDEVVLLNSHVVLFPDTWARVDGDVVRGWGQMLQRENLLRVPLAEREAFLASLAEFPNPPETTWPEDLTIESGMGQATGVLRLKNQKPPRDPRIWFGEVHFDYGAAQFGLHDKRGGVYDPETNRFLRRDVERERELVRQLDSQPVLRLSQWEQHQTEAQRKVHERSLPQVVESLTQAGWHVEAEGVKMRRPGQVRLSVTSEVDWFELDGAVDFEGVSASLPSLLQAVRNNEKYVVLDDGTRGLLPEEWLKKYGKLAELGSAEGDSLRFAPSQAMLLDALLAAQEQDMVSVDERFDEFRSRLRSFEGVKPADAPDGFQGTLRPYQCDGLGWLHFLSEFGLGGCLADDMGLGKTVQVLAMLETRRQQRAKERDSTPSIVVVPKSLIFNWVEEAERFTPELRVMNYTGLGRGELRQQFNQHDVIVTTYGTLRRDIVELKDHKFDYAILDESQAIKNAGSQAAKAVRLLDAHHRLAMTGTPVENHLGELWSLFEFLNPGMLGRSRVFASLTRGGGDDREWLGVLAQSLRPFLLRRTKQQVLTDLPDKTEQTLHCEMSPRERKRYNELRDYYRAQLTDRVATHGLEKSKIHVLEALLRLRQAACHPGLLDKKKLDEPSAKLETLLEQVQEVVEEGHKALVFSQFTSLLSIVRKQFDARGLKYAYLDGRTRKRGECVKQFQDDPACPLFLISLKAGGHGLNLTAADYVFILDPWWNPAVEAQAVDRAHRIGQTRHVFAYRLICRDTVEDKIIELQKSKRELADAIVSADDSLLRTLTAQDLEMLFQ